MPPDNFFTLALDAVTRLVTENADVFLMTGWNWFRPAAVIMIVLYGLTGIFSGGKTAADAISGLIRLCVMVVICITLLRYYTAPLPGVSKSFPGVITSTGASLAQQIDTEMTGRVVEKFNSVILGQEAPSWASGLGNIRGLVYYWTTQFMLTLSQAAVLAIISFGWIAVGALVLMGPLFIWTLLIPRLEQYFWSWLSALVQYSFYPVIGNAVVFVYGVIMMRFFDLFPGPYTLADASRVSLMLLMMLITMVWGVFKIPTLVSDTFRGTSGAHAMPGIGGWRG